MIVAWVTALTSLLVYMVLAGCAPDLPAEFKVAFIFLIVGAWVRLVMLAERRHR